MRIALLAFLLFAFEACSSNDDDTGLLKNEPYKAYTDSIAEFPQQADLYYKRGTLLYQNQQLSLAESDIEKAWQLSPSEPYALSLTTIYQKKHTDTAVTFLQEASKKLPGSIAIQVGLARGYQEKNDDQKALAICDAILTAHPGQLDALILKYELLKKSGQESQALQVLETAYSFAPFDPELVHNLAFEYAISGNAKVMALSDSLIRADVKQAHAEPYYFKAVYFNKTGQTDKSLQQLEEAIRHNYYFIDAHMEKGEILYNTGKHTDALKAFRLASTISPTYAPVYFWLGKTDEALGQKQEAKMNYQRAYSLDKTMTEAKTAADRL